VDCDLIEFKQKQKLLFKYIFLKIKS